jgi:ketosteroid isomerase-like protein
MTPTETVHEFINAINQQHIDKMVSLMTPDHTFVDSLGKVIPSRRAMRDAWLGFFEIVPDYTVTVNETFADAERVVVLGTASGTFSKDGEIQAQNRWSVPAAWRAVVAGGRIDRWNAFVDNEPLRRIMRYCGVLEPEE